MRWLPLSPDHAEPLGPFWSAWPAEPVLLIGLTVSLALYLLGRSRLGRRSPAAAGPSWRAWCFGGGMLALALALLSPIAVYSERLFFTHMVQHLLLLLVAPPLL